MNELEEIKRWGDEAEACIGRGIVARGELNENKGLLFAYSRVLALLDGCTVVKGEVLAEVDTEVFLFIDDALQVLNIHGQLTEENRVWFGQMRIRKGGKNCGNYRHAHVLITKREKGE